jgi:hypothetical protein
LKNLLHAHGVRLLLEPRASVRQGAPGATFC